MKIIVERDKFADAAAAATRSAGGATKIPILSNLLIKPNGKAVHIAGTQLDMQLETTCAAEISGSSGEAFTVPGAAIVDLVNRMPDGAQIEIEWNPGANAHATLRSGRARYKLLTLPSDQFPELMQTKEPVTFSLPAAQLISALAPIRFAMCRDYTRNNIRGIHVHPSAERHPVFAPTRDHALRFVACDMFNLGISSIPLPIGAENMPEFTLPDSTIAEVIKLATDAREETVELSVTPTLFSMTAAGKTFTTKLIGEEYINYVYPIPTEFACRGIIDCDEWSAALGRLLSIDDGKRMRATIKDGTLHMRLLNHKVGEADEEVEVGEWEGPAIERNMNAGSLAAIVEAAKADACLIQFTESARTPTIIQPWRAGVADATRTFLTMPME